MRGGKLGRNGEEKTQCVGAILTVADTDKGERAGFGRVHVYVNVAVSFIPSAQSFCASMRISFASRNRFDRLETRAQTRAQS